MSNLTDSIVNFLSAEQWQAPPEAALALAKRGFVDCLGVAIAGYNAPSTQVIRRYVNARQEVNGSCRQLLTESWVSCASAALVGTMAAHALDYDDYAFSNHVSALLVPAIIADAERINASGLRMLHAYIAGFEVWGAVFKREPDHLHSKGWHPTGIFGPIGVAAALAKLRGFTASETRNALGLAAACGGGVMDNFGSHAKPWQGARAAEAGVTAVDLAQIGMTAGDHALDGDGGLMAALSPFDRVDRTSTGVQLGTTWLTEGPSLNIKPYPTVGASQRSIQAALQLHEHVRDRIDHIRAVTIRVSEKHAAVMRLRRPKTASEARFSAEFGVAAALIAGQVTLYELRDEFVQRGDIQRLMTLIRVETGPDNDPSYPVGAVYDEVSIALNDGTTIVSDPVYRFKGHGENPMDDNMLKEKFRACAVEGGLSAEQASSLWVCLTQLEQVDSARSLPTLAINAVDRGH